LLAQALVRAGHVQTISEAFERYLGEGRPAYVGRQGAPPGQVIELMARANGLVSLAHPGKLKRDDWIPEFVDAGLPAIEVRHPDHDAADEMRYRQMAARYGLLVTGGSDYHGPGSGRTEGLGRVTLDREDFDRLAARAGWTPEPV
jgi:predicted metal-dependent phosphoesterase TrpH